MLSRKTVIAIDLFLVLFNLAVSAFHASRIYGGDLRGVVVFSMYLSACMGIVILLAIVWYLRECKQQDRLMASILMDLVHGHAQGGVSAT